MLIYVIRFLRAWRRCSHTLQQLSLLSDRELADAGITREDIPRVAWERSER
jgi:uncharacterized protein YjiS (DUF1127 family)